MTRDEAIKTLVSRIHAAVGTNEEKARDLLRESDRETIMLELARLYGLEDRTKKWLQAKMTLVDRATPEIEKLRMEIAKLDEAGSVGPPFTWILTAIAVVLLGIAAAGFFAGRL